MVRAFFHFKGKKKIKVYPKNVEVTRIENDAHKMFPIAETGMPISDRVVGYHHLRITFAKGSMDITWE